MKKALFIASAFFLISAGFFSCGSENAEDCKTFSDNIMGRWKLIEVSVRVNFLQPETTDYSDEKIIFDFQNNNKLVVTGFIPDVLVVFDDFQPGEHFYAYTPYECGACPPPCNLLIDDRRWEQVYGYDCKVSLDEETMNIVGYIPFGGIIDDNSLVTGGDIYSFEKRFIKLKAL
jgi:hypothetical protein